MLEANVAKQFMEILLNSKKNFLELQQIMQNEQNQLETSGFKQDTFSEIVKLKEKKLERIAEDVKERNLFLVNLGIKPNSQGLDNFLAQLPDEPKAEIEQIWHDLEDLLEQIQLQNLTNGRLANNAQTHLDLMIKILHDASPSGKIYKSKGESQNINTTRDLGSA